MTSILALFSICTELSYTPIVSVVGCVGALVSPVLCVSLCLSHSVQQLVSLCSQLVQIS